MSQAADANIVEIIERLVSRVQERLPEDPARQVQRFVAQYYRGTAAEDLAGTPLVDLYGAALAHFNLAKHYKRGRPKIHVYNPCFEQHGWQSTHTIIEVVSDDMPFLIDSVRMALNERGLTNHLIIHPVMRIRRDRRGHLLEVVDHNTPQQGGQADEDGFDAIMHFEVDRQTEDQVLTGIRKDLGRVLDDVRAAVEDWAAMQERVRRILSELADHPPPVDPEELAETRAFLQWIENDHFTFLGYREYELLNEEGDDMLRSVAGSGLGILRNPGERAVSQSFAALPAAVRRLVREPKLLIVTKGNARSTVHRPGYMDYIGIKRITSQGRVVGERRFLGLYTAAAYNRVPRAIPLLRQKVAKVLAQAGYPPNSYAYKALVQILEDFPRDQLFQVSGVELYATAMGILHLQERQQVRLFIHRDRFGRFFSCLIYVPRERFNTEVRQRIHAILEQAVGGHVTDFSIQLSGSVLARVQFIIRIPPGHVPEYDVPSIEAQIVEATRAWKDMLFEALLEHRGEEHGTRLFRRYGDAFRADYREHYVPRTAVYDIAKMESLCPEHCLAMSLYRPLEAAEGRLQFKLYRLGHPIPLSGALPMLENMGLTVVDEAPSKIKIPHEAEPIWIHDFGLEYRERELEVDLIRELFQDAFASIWTARVEDDGFNRLVLRAHLGWQEIVVLRAYCKYLRQTQVAFSQAYMEQALANNPRIARSLVRLFHARFNPATAKKPASVERLAQEIAKALDSTVASLDEDRILRSFLHLIKATLRTNYYQCMEDGQPKPYLSFKLDPAGIPELPEPRPLYEIFVYSPRMEGVHLRGGKVARGGLRWSDRKEDFRTEVLGLLKAQMVKNAVIVPMGAKGGFVAKRLPMEGSRPAIREEVVACYRTFVRGLLDVTDNLIEGQVVPCRNVLRYDDDDPYLVVAADKGTAEFSDVANEIAREYGFWLGDAFASGGSTGYDHKQMGITARGAWECVKRHFRELEMDIQTTNFTVVGIGDMSGDVFGNAMLLSEHIKLVAAFNHQHIFLDPDPDPEKSYRERKRLFSLPQSSWSDYAPDALSKGGGVYPRPAKSIVLSSQAQRALRLSAKALVPNELIRAILRAPVDLLWNGGIGTFVRAGDELNVEVGDRANDGIRISADELRCQVIGEGGNLGLTQRARIEFALGGGLINTDAIDNSGGVDCSDHEVNIKILLNQVVANGEMTEKQRNRLLAEMTDEVARLVLGNNYLQSEALSIARLRASSLVDVHRRLIRMLEREGKLDRALEYLPSDENLAERQAKGQGLTAPELAVLLAYCKVVLVNELVNSEFSNDPYLAGELGAYFPFPLKDQFAAELRAHPLAREIVCTQVANNLVNRGGVTFAFRLSEETGAAAYAIAKSYLVAWQIFDMERLWSEIKALDNRVPAKVQLSMLAQARKFTERVTRWLLRKRPQPLDVAQTVDYFAPGVSLLVEGLSQWLADINRDVVHQTVTRYLEAGVPEPLARHVASFNELLSALDIVEVAHSAQTTVEEVAAVYFQLVATLELHWLRDQIANLPRENRWQILAGSALREDLYSQQSALTLNVIKTTSTGAPVAARIADWVRGMGPAIERFQAILADLKGIDTPDFSMLSVAMGDLRSLRPWAAASGLPPNAPEVTAESIRRGTG